MTLNKGSKFNVYKDMGQMVYNCKELGCMAMKGLG